METTTTHETEFGSVDIGPDSVDIRATGAQLYNWAHRPGAVWPCSTLEDFDSIGVGFDTNGLVELETSADGTYSNEDGTYEINGYRVEIDGTELNAWSSDVLREVLPESHPCYFVTVGQFS